MQTFKSSNEFIDLFLINLGTTNGFKFVLITTQDFLTIIDVMFMQCHKPLHTFLMIFHYPIL
jgi:hypothetical protein